MGKSVAEAAVSAGLQLVPVSFSAIEVPDGKLNICDRDIHIHDPSESERILRSIAKDYPDMIVVDYTVPDAVNGKHISNFYWTAECFLSFRYKYNILDNSLYSICTIVNSYT